MVNDIVKGAKEAYAECVEAESDNRTNAIADLRFARLGEQWPDEIARLRKGRPMLTINRMPSFIRRVTNNARQNKPAVKVHPVDSNADVQTAEVINGLIRNIEYTSNADAARDTAIDFAASCGFGYTRIVTEYACDDSFDLDIRFKRVANPFSIRADPYSTETDSSDWNVAFVEETYSPDQFRKEYPDAKPTSWEIEEGSSDSDTEDKSITVVEYWTRDKITRNLLKLSDGQVVFEDEFLEVDPNTNLSMKDIAELQGVTVANQRQTMSYRVKQHILSGEEELEANDWKGKYIPIIPYYGEELNVEGKRHFLSLIRQAKDEQTRFNVWHSAATEMVGLMPKAPFIGKKGAFKSDPNWQTANNESHAFLEYDGPEAPMRPQYNGAGAAEMQMALSSSDNMKDILGIQDAALGKQSNETSGVAIRQRQQEGDLSAFHIIDNASRAIRHEGIILIDLIPHFYSDERIIRVLGEDGTPKSVTINTQAPQEDGSFKPIHQLGLGKYDLTVTTGPSYTTRRQEAAEQMTEIIRAFPEAAPIIAPRLAKNSDWPESQEIAADFEKLNPVNQPPQDPMQSPEMLKATAQLQLKEKEVAATAAQKQQELELKKQEAELNAEIKIREHEMEMEQMQQKHSMTMQHANQQQMSKLHGDTMKQMEPVEGEGGELKHPLMMLVEAVAQSAVATQEANQQLAGAVMENTQAIVESNQQLAEVMTRPKNVSMKTSQGKTLQATIN